MNVLLLRPVPANERFGLGPFFRIEPLGHGIHRGGARSARPPRHARRPSLPALRWPLTFVARVPPSSASRRCTRSKPTKWSRSPSACERCCRTCRSSSAATPPRRIRSRFWSPAVTAVVLDDGERAMPAICAAIDRRRAADDRARSGAARSRPARGPNAGRDRHARARRGAAAGASSRRIVAAAVRVSGAPAGVSRRDGARLSVPLHVLLDLAGPRAHGPRAVDRLGVPGLRVGRRSRVRRRRSVLAPSAAQPRTGARAPAPRRPQEMDPGPEPHGSGRQAP